MDPLPTVVCCGVPLVFRRPEDSTIWWANCSLCRSWGISALPLKGEDRDRAVAELEEGLAMVEDLRRDTMPDLMCCDVPIVWCEADQDFWEGACPECDRQFSFFEAVPLERP